MMSIRRLLNLHIFWDNALCTFANSVAKILAISSTKHFFF